VEISTAMYVVDNFLGNGEGILKISLHLPMLYRKVECLIFET